MLCKPNTICSCLVPCSRCKCVIETDEKGRIIPQKKIKFKAPINITI